MQRVGMNTSFRMFPDSSAAKVEKGEKTKLSPEALAMQQMMRDIHLSTFKQATQERLSFG